MARPCNRRNPLIRSGLTQDARRRAELRPDYFLPDERDLADLVLFGQRFAKHIRYYSPENIDAGDWSRFFESDVTAGLAALAKLPVETFRTFQKDLEAWLSKEPDRDVGQLASHFLLVFHLPVALLERVAVLQARLPADHPLATTIVQLTRRDLAQPLRALVSWFKGALTVTGATLITDTIVPRIAYNVANESVGPGLRISAAIADLVLDRPELSRSSLRSAVLAQPTPGDWGSLYWNTPADTAPYLDAIGQPHQAYEQIYDALNYNLLTTTIGQIYQVIESIRREAAAQLGASLDSFAGHTPHYGLWLTFLQLFRHAQAELNTFTGRHMDFYFREVLGLSSRPGVPDKAHVLLELAKGHDSHLLAAGALFRAGKDALGRTVSYTTENDIVVNRAYVDQVRGLQVATSGPPEAIGQTALAAAVVRSRDGVGATPLAAGEAWAPFGPTDSPHARVGFAIADRKLFLREGARTISIQAELKTVLPVPGVSPRWKARLSAEKGWLELAGSARIGTRFDGGVRRAQVLEITLSLNADDPAVIPFDAKLHGTEHAPGAPVVEIAFDFEAPESARAFAVLRDIEASHVTLRTEAAGLKNLTVVADGAGVDISKAFAPFGAQPKAGAPLIVGSSEIFSKPIAALRLGLDWDTPYNTTGFFWNTASQRYNPAEAVLRAGRWETAAKLADIQLGGTGVTVELSGAPLIDGRARQTLKNPPFEATSVNGFLRLRPALGFGHAAYHLESTKALLSYASGKPYVSGAEINVSKATLYAPEEPLKPYTPVITRFEAAYETPRGPVEVFSLLHPFGTSAATVEGRLFPALPFEGALLIGLADLDPPCRITLLIQVADGSGNPLKPAPDLAFAYLAGDAWIDFLPQEVDDKTVGLSTSGILGLKVPERADTDHRILPAGRHWIRIAVRRDADALNRLMSIDAQAVRVVFADAGNDPAFLRTPLAAGSISKLVVPDLAIKKVRQPYSSFGGREPEPPEAFAPRVSERLRHKDRGVTMFDYETLVLEAFPNLHRVKCLNTTELQRDGRGIVVADNELMPGAVSIVVIPKTHGRNISDPLRPWADQATLRAVDAFLRRRISPFVRLEVQNPKFEEVIVDFKVRFRPEVADTAFYADELNMALVGFLTPWSRPDGGEITFGGKLWKSAIIDFIEEQPQVDFVTDVMLFHKIDADAGPGDWSPADVELVEASTARSILVSGLNRVHVDA